VSQQALSYLSSSAALAQSPGHFHVLSLIQVARWRGVSSVHVLLEVSKAKGIQAVRCRVLV
jgi:hypothetical protein